MVHDFDPSIQDVETDRSLLGRGQFGLQSEFQDSQGYRKKNPVSKKKSRVVEMEDLRGHIVQRRVLGEEERSMTSLAGQSRL